MGIESAPRSVRLRVWIDPQHNTRDLAPVGAILIGVKRAYVCDRVLLIVFGEGRSTRRYSPTFASIRGGIEQPHWMKRGVGVWRAEAPVVVESTSVPTIGSGRIKVDLEQRMKSMRPYRDRQPAQPTCVIDDLPREF